MTDLSLGIYVRAWEIEVTQKRGKFKFQYERNNQFFGSTNNIWTLVYIVNITISLHFPGYKRGFPRLNVRITGLTVEQSYIRSCGSHTVFADHDGQKGWGFRWATFTLFFYSIERSDTSAPTNFTNFDPWTLSFYK